MIKIESQLHGYRHGHELIETTVPLEKGDQAVVDRLSDVAGPLRSGDTFSPYFATYPLPSGKWTVLARTWPDDTVSRPGCVRTLSLLIPAEAWANSPSVSPFIKLLDKRELPSAALRMSITEPQEMPLPPAPLFSASELLEALFLEEQRPVAIFDAPEPELIATRLLTALWPSMRRQFALSTLALSPRRIEGREFNLVFAPRSARQKFSEWAGRRVDGQARVGARHRWTSSIVERVFGAPVPRLVEDSDLYGANQVEDATGALLRISLLWDELLTKVEHSPAAALGLLDIAKSRSVLSSQAMTTVQSVLASATRRAVDELPIQDAWILIGAIARKIHATPFATEFHSLQSAAALLARKDPTGALHLLTLDDPVDALSSLVAPIAMGVAEYCSMRGKVLPWDVFSAVPQKRVVQLLIDGPALARTIAFSREMQAEVLAYVVGLSLEMFVAVRDALLPNLVENFQVGLASHFIASLDADTLLKTVHELIGTNDLSATSFLRPLAARARAVQAANGLRGLLKRVQDDARRIALIQASLDPRKEDIEWLLNDSDLTETESQKILVDLLVSADEQQFRALLSEEMLRNTLLVRIPSSARDVFCRLLREGNLPLDQHVAVLRRVLDDRCLQDDDHIDIAFGALERCLVDHFSGDEIEVIGSLLNFVGPVLNPRWAISQGLGNSLDGSLIRRNLLAFESTSTDARSRIVNSLDELSEALGKRWSLDLDAHSAQACANLFWSAAQLQSPDLLTATARMVRLLFRSREWPVSAIMPATFPVVYRELAAGDDVPDMLKFMSFFDWDKCKAARRELIDAFDSSEWDVADLALTICLCPHEEKFVHRIARSFRGDALLNKLARSLERLPQSCGERLEVAIRDVRMDR
ncbi:MULTISPECIES: hypothetical protein [Achromobacter]|uniref:Uncharacterized protein n=1 Tax=Achromobacter spanius TaxID=217203 RepID=A0ABY8GT16_9BURK|nr:MULTISPECIES: hypothetical protein [Achromobacter]WAI83046.1 hypothetical protein N8Z00_26690 [Achromobacter spanius]WEX93131.1 hypothetical protein N3Z32_21285 [Achromobacter sp. SS2-2022]WFP07713.1 hypothetical protein P8T11_25975 [Achromobacter spanius]